MSDQDRQTGRTTDQMLAAPIGAVFVWVNSSITYPRDLAAHLGREDLRIYPRAHLAEQARFLGLQVKVVVDHALGRPSEQEWQTISMLRTRGLIE